MKQWCLFGWSKRLRDMLSELIVERLLSAGGIVMQQDAFTFSLYLT